MAAELIRRGARVEFNPYGYGPEDFNIPKVARAKSLLQHTEQLQHEQNVCAAWAFFRRQAEKTGYSVKCKSVCGRQIAVIDSCICKSTYKFYISLLL